MPNYSGVWDLKEQGVAVKGNTWTGLLGSGFALVAGDNPTSATIDFINTVTLSNATDFGDLLSAMNNFAALGSSTRAVFAGGQTSSAVLNVIQYSTFASTGTLSDFGDLSATASTSSGSSSSTRGIINLGYSGCGYSNVIEYITIASAGNSTDFGDLTLARGSESGASASPTRGTLSGGYTGSKSNVIDYITIASAGNATDFGDLLAADLTVAACASSTRGLIGGVMGQELQQTSFNILQ